MRAAARCVLLIVGLVVVASATAHESKPRAPMVLHPKWHLLAPRGVALVSVSGRYVYVGSFTGPASVIDEQTHHTIRLNPPAGCFFSTDFSPLGGSWLVAECNSAPGDLMLYSIPHAHWTRFTPNAARMCALNPDCAPGTSRVPCSPQYGAIGTRWIEFSFGCGYHSGTITTVLQQIRGGDVIAVPDSEIPGLQGGATHILDLNSPTGTRRLCSPLRVPTSAKFALGGRFAVEESNLNEDVFLEQCGSHSRMMIGRGFVSINSRTVLMSVGATSNSIPGLFLPSRRRFALRLPPQVASKCARAGAFVCIENLVLTSRTVYVVTGDLQLWSASLPISAGKKTD